MLLLKPLPTLNSFTKALVWVFCLVFAVVLGSLVCFFDIFASTLYLSVHGTRDLGYLLLFSAFLLYPTRCCARYFLQKQGYGAISVYFCFLSFLATIYVFQESAKSALTMILFFVKYPVALLLVSAFLGIVSRVMRVNTKDASGLWGVIFSGYITASAACLFLNLSTDSFLIILAILCTGILFFLGFIMKIMPVEREMFITKTGAIQTVIEQKLVGSTYLLGFFTFFAQSIAMVVFYKTVLKLSASMDIMHIFCCWWLGVGMTGLVVVTVLAQVRYVPALFASVLALISALIVLAFGSDVSSYLVLASFGVFELMLMLYFNGYVLSLLCLLSVGHKKSISKIRTVVVEPCGFMLGALCFIYFPSIVQNNLFLYATALLLYALVFASMKFYATLLLRILKIRGWRAGQLILPAEARKYIQTNIQTSNSDDVIYFLCILEKAKSSAYIRYLLKALNHQEERVRLYALDVISQFKNAQRYFKTITWVFQKDTSNKVRCRALCLLIQLSYKENPDFGVNGYLTYLDHKILKKGAMSGLLQTGGVHALLAMDGLQRLVNSKKEKDNLLALDIMAQAPSVGLIRLVNRLLKSTNTAVSAKALLVAGKIQHPEFLPFILNALKDFDLRENALIALKAYGIKAFPLIEKQLYNPATPSSLRKTLILFLTYLQSGRGKQILLRALKIGNQNLRKTIIQGMIDSGIFWVHKGKYNLLKEGIEKDAERLFRIQQFLEKYQHAPTPETRDVFAFLSRAMREDFLETRDMILYQLLLLKEVDVFSKAVRVLLSDKTESYPVALGVLQDMLPKDLHQIITKVILSDQEKKQEVIGTAITPQEAVADLSELLLHPPFPLPDWTKACLLYCLRQLGLPAGLKAVLEMLHSKNPLVLEAAVWALMRLEKDENERHKILLQVPTSLLITQPVENMLITE